VKSSVESLDPTTVKLAVEITPDEFATALEEVYQQVGQELTMPGFRRGKIPRPLIDRRVGRANLVQHAVELGIDGWITAALREHSVRPLAPVELDVTKEADPTAAEPDFEFAVTVEIAPPIDIPDISATTVTVDPGAASDEAVDAELDMLRGRFASLRTVDRPAAEDDFATIDLTAEIDSVEVDSVSGISYQVGSGRLMDGLDEALDGLSAGETTTFETALVAGEHGGSQALITVRLTAVKERELPPLDDAFAEMASSNDTVAELREDIRGQIEDRRRRSQVSQARDRLIDQLVETVEFPLPPKTLGREVAAAEAQAARTAAAQAGEQLGDEPSRRDVEKWLDDAAREQAQDAAAKLVRSELILDALVARFGVKPTAQDVLTLIGNIAVRSGIDPAAYLEAVRSSGELDSFYQEVARSQALVAALRLVGVREADGAVVDIVPLLDEQQSLEEIADNVTDLEDE
jgi:trigger factor